MSPKAGDMRAPAELSLAQSPRKPIGSCNGCSFPWPNRIQTQSWRVSIRDYAADERTAIATRFWSKVKKSDGCWLWTASATGGHGIQHGQFTLRRIAGGSQPHIYAHRLSWELTYGPIPDELQVCHHCDVPLCVRPEHLFLGTQDDNLKDAARKRRFHTPRTRAGLTLADRLAIFAMPDRRGVVIELALHYRVSTACIYQIRRGGFVGSPLKPIAPRAQADQLVGDLHQESRDAGVRHA